MNQQNFLDRVDDSTLVDRPKQEESLTPPMTIVVDTREQLPYTFEQYENCKTIRQKLEFGDYAIAAYEFYICIERKSLPDFIGSITHGRTRFFNEIKHLAKSPFSVILIEATWQDILEHKYQQDVKVASVVGTIMAIELNYRVSCVFGGDRQHAQAWAYHYLLRFHKNHNSILREATP